MPSSPSAVGGRAGYYETFTPDPRVSAQFGLSNRTAPRGPRMNGSPLMNVSAPHRILGRSSSAGSARYLSRECGCCRATRLSRPRRLRGPVGCGSWVGVDPERAAETVTWSVIPASATQPDTRSKFSYDEHQARVDDHGPRRDAQPQQPGLAFSIYATDATGTTASNALILMPAAQKPQRHRRLGDIPQAASTELSIVIPGKKGIIEAFTLAVPRQATPGDHTGGLIARSASTAQERPRADGARTSGSRCRSSCG